MKSLEIFLEEIAASSTTTASIPVDTGVHVKKKKKLPEADGHAIGHPYFDADHGTFTAAIQGKDKYARWTKFLDSNEQLSTRIKEYKKSFPKKKILLKNSTTGEYMFAHKMK